MNYTAFKKKKDYKQELHPIINKLHEMNFK